MASMSDYLEGQLIDHVFRTNTFTKPTVLAFALLTTNAVDADTGQFTTGTGVEVTNANAYARQDRPPLDANWDAPTAGDGLTDNAAALTFPTASGGSWGTITGAAICSSTTYDTGNMYLHGALTASKVIGDGDTFNFPAGNIDITWA